ncbi:MAG: isochorismate synthase [Microcoleaceae cyanobacterium]
MNILKNLENMVIYLSDGFARIFTLNKDIYPYIGVSPFEGTPYKGSGWDD